MWLGIPGLPEGARAACYDFGRLHRETAALPGRPSVAAGV